MVAVSNGKVGIIVTTNKKGDIIVTTNRKGDVIVTTNTEVLDHPIMSDYNFINLIGFTFSEFTKSQKLPFDIERMWLTSKRESDDVNKASGSTLLSLCGYRLQYSFTGRAIPQSSGR